MNTFIVVAYTKYDRERLLAVVDTLSDEYPVNVENKLSRFMTPAKVTARFHGLHHTDITNIKEHLGDQLSYQLI